MTTRYLLIENIAGKLEKARDYVQLTFLFPFLQDDLEKYLHVEIIRETRGKKERDIFFLDKKLESYTREHYNGDKWLLLKKYYSNNRHLSNFYHKGKLIESGEIVDGLRQGKWTKRQGNFLIETFYKRGEVIGDPDSYWVGGLL